LTQSPPMNRTAPPLGAVANGAGTRFVPFAWATWRFALILILSITAARLAHALWLSPWELVGDEAYYWLQAHHLDFGYTEKGPLLAWLIAASCGLFGDKEWAVRLPVILASTAAAWGVGKMAISIARGDQRIGFFAVLIFLLLPPFEANARICTQDGLVIALWVALTAVTLRLLRRWRCGQGVWFEWLLFWGLMGAGLLLKQSVVTFLPGFGLYWLLYRKELPLRPVVVPQQAAGLVIMLAVASPMLLWNAAHGWPMIMHTLGHLGAGGDQAGKIYSGNPVLWEANLIGSFIGAFGPASALMIWACNRAYRRRRDDPDMWRDQLWLMYAVWPTVIFFILLALTKPVVPSWPLPTMAPIVVLIAQLVVTELSLHRAGAKPDKVFRGLWRTTLLFGIGAIIILAYPTIIASAPVYGDRAREKILRRLTGHKDRFLRLDAVLRQIPTPDGRPPLLVAPNYQQASLATFYLPGHPPATTRGNYFGHRPSNFDDWPETDLTDPRHSGRNLVLMLNGKDPHWQNVFLVDRIGPSPDPGYLIAYNFRGIRGAAPKTQAPKP